MPKQESISHQTMAHECADAVRDLLPMLRRPFHNTLRHLSHLSHDERCERQRSGAVSLLVALVEQGRALPLTRTRPLPSRTGSRRLRRTDPPTPRSSAWPIGAWGMRRSARRMSSYHWNSRLRFTRASRVRWRSDPCTGHQPARGQRVLHRGQRSEVDNRSRRTRSHFQIGVRWRTHQYISGQRAPWYLQLWNPHLRTSDTVVMSERGRG